MNFRVLLATAVVAIPALLVAYHNQSGGFLGVAADLLKQNVGTIILSTYAFASSVPFLKGRKARVAESERIAAAGEEFTGRRFWSFGLLIAGILAISNLALGAAFGGSIGFLMRDGFLNTELQQSNPMALLYSVMGYFVPFILLPILYCIALLLGRWIYRSSRRRPLLTALVASVIYLLFKIGDTIGAMSLSGIDWAALTTSELLQAFGPVTGGIALIPVFLFVGIGLGALTSNRWDYEILDRVKRLAQDQKLLVLKQIGTLFAVLPKSEPSSAAAPEPVPKAPDPVPAE